MKHSPQPDLDFEKSLWDAGLETLAGLDEAGRGAWAGPVAAAAVILPVDPAVRGHLRGVRDSKRMTPTQRGIWAKKIKEIALCWGVGFASNQEIDEIGIVPATRLAMKRSLAGLSKEPQHLLLDYIKLPEESLPQTILIRGDSRCLSIAAASVIAKIQRDALMVKFDGSHPGYGFARHKGYGTRIHQSALTALGPCNIHRFSFKPLKRLKTE
jgi:ribonuclease HII